MKDYNKYAHEKFQTPEHAFRHFESAQRMMEEVDEMLADDEVNDCY